MATSGSKSIAATSNDTLQLIADSYGRISSTASKDWSVTINGTKYSGTNTIGLGNGETKTLASGSTTIAHNADGTKTFSYSFSQELAITWSGEYIGTKSGSGTGTLDTIPRKSTLSVANGTLGTAQTLTIERNSSSFTHTIVATCGSASTTIATKTTSTSVSFTPPLSWASQNTTGTSVSVTYKITTYNGSTDLGSNSYTKTCSIPSSVKPSCAITVSESTSYGAYVKGLSKLKIVVTPTTSYGSAIESYSVSANGSTYTTATVTTGALTSAGTMTITATVKDKRGRTGTATATITVVDKSTFTIANGTLGTAQTVSITKGHSTFKHKITYSCGSASGYVLGNASTFSTDASVSWTPPLTLASQNTTGTTLSVTVTLYTYANNGTSIGNTSKTITMTIPSSVVPTCSLSVSDAMGYQSTYGGYIKGYSKFKVVVTPTLAYGSEITTFSAMANGVIYTSDEFETGLISSYGTLTITATVKDERGRSGTASATAKVLDYASPKISKLAVKRCNSDGTENAKGEYVQVTFSGSVTSLNNKNSAKYVLKYKKSNATSYTSVVMSAYNNVYSVTDATYIFSADTGSSYNVVLEITDNLATSDTQTVASTAFSILHFLKTGLGLAIGKIAEIDNLLDIGFATRFRNGVTIDSEWIDLVLDDAFAVYDNTESNIPKCKGRAGIVTIQGSVSPKTEFESNNIPVVIASGIPEGMRPTEHLQFICQGSGMNRWNLTVRTDGRITMARYGTTGATTVPTTAWLVFCVTYQV